MRNDFGILGDHHRGINTSYLRLATMYSVFLLVFFRDNINNISVRLHESQVWLKLPDTIMLFLGQENIVFRR